MPKFHCPVCGRSVRFLKDHIARFHPEHFASSTSQVKPKISMPHASEKPLFWQKTDQKKVPSQIIVVDGQNVAYFGDRGKPSYVNLEVVYKALKTIGYTPKIIISSALKYKVNDPVRLNRMISRGIVIEAPSGEDDDLTVLELAHTYKAKIVTNDRYLDHKDIFPTFKKQTVKFKIYNRSVVFEPPLD
ncbi:MAG: hypothetical protein ACFFC7_11665 [Candidatus Hermodarchaeota archaeon]